MANLFLRPLSILFHIFLLKGKINREPLQTSKQPGAIVRYDYKRFNKVNVNFYYTNKTPYNADRRLKGFQVRHHKIHVYIDINLGKCSYFVLSADAMFFNKLSCNKIRKLICFG
ncbi:unnamed protein product [Spodoptera littoralis]|uniref:Uncharacterized protein n=1 Tax=Spodoptera littoralis TaxID=7109 RepID=A0A9P0N5Y6_SPOLI|nr:unnamed protein product [Spodoptera littoralis]CAH1646192.1 unnamed protein product [Spodoptera littoralis]